MDITLAIPVYDVEPYVRQSLLSALEQDFGGTYEVLVIDDCGHDRSMEIVQALASEHPRGSLLRIVRHPENLGLGAARNTAIDEAQGRYLLFLDSDDCLMPDALSHLYRLAEAEQADVVAGSTVEADACPAGKAQQRERYPLFDNVIRQPSAGVWMYAHQLEMNIEVWNKLFRMDFLRRHQIRTTHRIMEDSVFDFLVRAYAGCIVTSSHVTMCYTQRPDSILGRICGQPIPDEVVMVYCDIILQVQRLIRERFSAIPGIYDLYCLRLYYTFLSLRRPVLTLGQEQLVTEQMRGFTRVIPSLHVLQKGTARSATLLCRLRQEDWRVFEYVFSHRYDFLIGMLSRILVRL